MSGEQRRLAAIMFTDMVGYTALGQRNEELSLALVEEQRKLIRPVLSRHGGKEVKTIGDAFLVVFPNAVDAVRCAYDIQRAIREFNFSLATVKRIHLRIGIHLGEIVESGNDVAGDAVNVASRIEPLAEDGGVCFTRQVYDHVRNKVDLPLNSLGAKALKNVTDPIEIYKMVMPWEGQGVAQAGELDRKRIAVLPLTNMSPDPNDGYFADGMTEELITALSRLSSLKVISRTSVMQYKNQAKSATAVARELNVGTLIEGSVKKAGNRIRITVQLIDANTDEHLWADTYDRNLEDVFEVQSDVASRVAGLLATGLFGTSQLKDTENIEAYTLYIRGMQLLHQGTEESLREAIELFDRATSVDASFVRAYAGLVDALNALASQNLEEFTSATRRAEAVARKAVEIGPNWPEAHVAMSTVLMNADRTQEAIAEAKTAIRVNPNLSEAYETMGIAYSSLGDLEQGIGDLKKAMELSPLSFQTGHILCHAYLAAGRKSEAMGVAEHSKQLHPGNPLTFHCLAQCHIQGRDLASAQQAVDSGRRVDPQAPVLIIDQGIIYAMAHKREAAEEQLRLIESSDKESVRLFGQVWICSVLGDLDKAFGALMRQAEIHAWYSLMKTEPLFEAMRGDPRFLDFCAKVGLPV